MKRRAFLQTGAIGAGAVALSQPSQTAAAQPEGRLPREIWVATLSMENLQATSIDKLLDRLFGRMEETLACQPHIICVPETFLYPGVSHSLPLNEISEELPGPIAARFSEFSKAHQCYAIGCFHTKQEGVIYNSAVLFDRHGEIAGVYNKTHPTISEMEDGVQPGTLGQPVIQTDLGTIGLQICFDVNWDDSWQPMRRAQAEIIFWPSAFPGGRMLNGKAWQMQSYLVTSTWSDPSRIIDITGDEIAATGRYDHWVCAPINLDKAFVHTWPYTKPIIALREKYKQDVRVTRLHDEGWTIIESRSPEVSVTTMLQEFDIPTHRRHIATSEDAQVKKWMT